LKKVHLFLLYFKNTVGYQKIYHICSERLRYIPFKINAYELIMKMKVSDEGYIFVGGRTRRDFPTLIEAVGDLPYPVKIVAPFKEELSRHGSCLDEFNLPRNVEVIHDDGTAESFIRFMAAARLVVLPIKKETISPSGISVYVMAMALRKCVIISSGPAVDGIISGKEAIIVPAGDPEYLRQALERAYTDGSYRSGFEEKGFEYAINLGGTQRLNENIINEIYRDFAGS
jgi:glycosyltransferase involved in cell wall biosynthesis